MDGIIERARSLSPTKSSSNAGTPTSTSIRSPINLPRQDDRSKSPTHSALQESKVTRNSGIAMDASSPLNNPPSPLPPPSSGPPKFKLSGRADTPQGSQQAPGSVRSSIGTSEPAASLSRAGTLSWQQRPSSRGSPGARPRPLSMITPKDSGAADPLRIVDRSTPVEKMVPRDQITRSLGAKDPSWFRQTQDRGNRSAAYRKQQPEEDQSKTTASTEKVHLQGLSRGPRAELPKETSPPVEGFRSISPSLDGSMRSTSSWDARHPTSASLSSSTGGFRSPLPILQSQMFEPPSSDSASSQGGERQSGRRALAMSPSQGRISPERMERPSSATKGLGGVCEMGMGEECGSVRKRWS